jgi:hypothetical protein
LYPTFQRQVSTCPLCDTAGEARPDLDHPERPREAERGREVIQMTEAEVVYVGVDLG